MKLVTTRGIIRTRGRDGNDHEFEFELDHSVEHDGEFWRYVIQPNTSPLDCFFAAFKVISDDRICVVQLEHHRHAEFEAMGIPEQIFEHVVQDSGRRLVSSSNKAESDDEFRTPDATKMWERLRRSGRATLNPDDNRYVFLPRARIDTA